MSRIRVVAARLYAAFIHAQLFVMSCRSKLTKFLLLIPMMCKRKLTAVCSHQTRIGNLDAHLI